MGRISFWPALLLGICYVEWNFHKENTESPVDASKEIREEINTEKYKCILMSRHHNARKRKERRQLRYSFKMLHTINKFGNNSNKPKFDS
jgi:hypothetical protein